MSDYLRWIRSYVVNEADRTTEIFAVADVVVVRPDQVRA
jgi:hypothetical protein